MPSERAMSAAVTRRLVVVWDIGRPLIRNRTCAR
jgi:hypothetical protein